MSPLSMKAFLEEERAQKEVLFFHTPFCGTCQLAEKMLNLIEAIPEFTTLPIYSCRVQEWQEVVQDWKIHSVPALVILSNGQVQQIIYAFQSVSYLYEQLQSSLG
jgi:thioredoxin-like negative regulator of GroEL